MQSNLPASLIIASESIYSWTPGKLQQLPGAVRSIMAEGGFDRFWGRTTSVATARDTVTYRDIDSWAAALGSNEESIEFEVATLIRSIRATFSIRNAEARIELNANQSDVDACRAMLARLAGILELRQLSQTRGGVSAWRAGERRKYLSLARLSKDELKTYLALLLPEGEELVAFEGRFRDAGFEYSRRNMEDWLEELKTKWDALAGFYCWFTTSLRSVTWDVDLNRESFALEVQGESATPAATFNALESRFHLQRNEGNPYQYRKYARGYRFDEWKDSLRPKLAKAIGDAIDKSFPARRQIVNAYVTSGEKVEDLDGFYELQPFLNRIRDSAFTSAHILVEGPEGKALGIRIEPPKSRMQLRSSLGKPEFKAVIEAFEPLDITLDKIEDEAPAKGDAAASRLSLWTPTIVAVIAAAAAILNTGVTYLLNTLPALKSTLDVTAPVRKDGVAQVDGLQVPIVWSFHTHGLWGDSTEPCSAVIVARTGSKVIPPEPPQPLPSGAYITLPEAGDYAVTVTPACRSGVEPVTFQLHIPPSPGTPHPGKSQ